MTENNQYKWKSNSTVSFVRPCFVSFGDDKEWFPGLWWNLDAIIKITGGDEARGALASRALEEIDRLREHRYVEGVVALDLDIDFGSGSNAT